MNNKIFKNVINIQSIYYEKIVAAVAGGLSGIVLELIFVWRFCFARQAACINEGCLE